MFFFRPSQRPQTARPIIMETMESRRLLSATGLRGGADDGPNHDRNDDHGVEVQHHHRHGGRAADDGANHQSGADDRAGQRRGRGRGADDGPNHR